MKTNIFVKALLLGLFTINLYANLYSKQNINAKELYVGGLFEIDVETILLEPSQKLYFDFENAEGVKVINPLQPKVTSDNVKTTHTFYLQALQPNIKTPDIVLTVIDAEYTNMQREVLASQKLQATPLHPPQNFSNIIARNLIVEGFQNSVYDKQNNIVAVKLFGEYTNLDDFNLTDVKKMEIKNKEIDLSNQVISFYAIVDKELENLSFSYFNLNSKTYKKIEFPINIQRDIVSTQTELHPQKSRVYQLKIYGSAAAAVVFLLLFIVYRKNYLFLALALTALFYLFYTLKPLALVTVKKESVVYILPTKNATAIVKIDTKQDVKKLSEYKDYVKVEFDSGMIGWVKKDMVNAD